MIIKPNNYTDNSILKLYNSDITLPSQEITNIKFLYTPLEVLLYYLQEGLYENEIIIKCFDELYSMDLKCYCGNIFEIGNKKKTKVNNI